MPQAPRFAQLPLAFEANRGQTSDEVLFVARGRGQTLFLTRTGPVFDIENSVLRMRFSGGKSSEPLVGLDELPGRTNYFIGRDSGRWVKSAPNYARVQQRSIYPGIDVVYYGTEGQLEYDMMVAPGAEPDVIAIQFEGASDLRLDHEGGLILSLPGGPMRFRAPIACQWRGDDRRKIECRYVLEDDGRVSFALGAYDRSAPLVIDPILEYSTYLGGSGHEQGGGIAVDGSGNVYVTGITRSLDFPTSNPRQPSLSGSSDRFVAKLDPSGTTLLYSTYLGGSRDESGLHGAVAVDASGNAYVTSGTQSLDFPVTAGAIETTLGGDQDAFLAKLDPTGSNLLYSTYLGGGGSDEGIDLAVDVSGNVCLVGLTTSNDFPTLNAFQPALGGDRDAFVTKLSTSPPGLVYSTYLGGGSFDWGVGIAVDGAGSAYVTGQTGSSNFPTTPGAFQTTFLGLDAFVVKLNASGSSLAYGTYLGGSSEDFGIDVAVDGSGNAYVTGATGSTDFPHANAFDGTKDFDGYTDAFVAKLNPAGTALVFSTFLGGVNGYFCAGSDVGTGIALEGSGRIYVTGYTESCDFPTAAPIQCINRGGVDAFLSVFDPSASTLVFSTYLGGTGHEYENYYHPAFTGGRVAVDATGNAYLVGFTQSTDFPVRNALQPAFGGDADLFLAKIDVNGGGPPSCDLAVSQSESSNPVTVGFSFQCFLSVRNLGPSCASDVVVRDRIPITTSFQSAVASRGSCYDSSGTVICTVGTMAPDDSATITIGLIAQTLGTAENFAAAATSALDINPENNASTATIVVRELEHADVYVRQTHAPNTASVNGILTFTLDVGNAGPDSARGVGLSHQLYGLPATIVSVTPTSGTCQVGGGFISCSLGTLAASESIRVAVAVVPLDTGLLNSYVSAGTSTQDPNFGNNDSYDAVAVLVSTETLLNNLSALVESYQLNRGLEHTLERELQNALGALAAMDTTEACTALADFRRRVGTHAGRQLTVAQASRLDTDAANVASVLQCGGAALAASLPISEGMETRAFSFRVATPPGGAPQRVALYLPAPARARLDVFDVGGRLVRVAYDQELPAGSHELTWDGRNSSGVRLSGGVYFLRLSAGSDRAIARITLLR